MTKEMQQKAITAFETDLTNLCKTVEQYALACYLSQKPDDYFDKQSKILKENVEIIKAFLKIKFELTLW